MDAGIASADNIAWLTHLRDSSLSKSLIFRCSQLLFPKTPLKSMVIF
jgi:hypothetical protein